MGLHYTHLSKVSAKWFTGGVFPTLLVVGKGGYNLFLSTCSKLCRLYSTKIILIPNTRKLETMKQFKLVACAISSTS